jgi:hypothetical protein
MRSILSLSAVSSHLQVETANVLICANFHQDLNNLSEISGLSTLKKPPGTETKTDAPVKTKAATNSSICFAPHKSGEHHQHEE